MEMHGSAGRKMKHASCVGTIYMYFFLLLMLVFGLVYVYFD
jgi:hypothetical protein